MLSVYSSLLAHDPLGSIQGVVWHQEEWILAPAGQTLKVYKEDLIESSHIYPVGVLDITSPCQGLFSELPLGAGKEGDFILQGQGRGRGAPKCPGPAHGPMGGHVFMMTFPSKVFCPFLLHYFDY